MEPIRLQIRGAEVDKETRCAHYCSPLDIIAIKMACCGVYYACKDCHELLAAVQSVCGRPQSGTREQFSVESATTN
jgi:uncharacterized CHY-type Zn-finger protein